MIRIIRTGLLLVPHNDPKGGGKKEKHYAAHLCLFHPASVFKQSLNFAECKSRPLGAFL